MQAYLCTHTTHTHRITKPYGIFCHKVLDAETLITGQERHWSSVRVKGKREMVAGRRDIMEGCRYKDMVKKTNLAFPLSGPVN